MQFLDQNSPNFINQSYKIWKKNVPFLYNTLQSYELASCSQTVQWFSESYIDSNWKIASLLIGTNALSGNSLMRCQIALPTDESIVDNSAYQQNKPEEELGTPGYVGTMGQQKLDIRQNISQNGQIMKARINKSSESNQNIIAVKIGGPNQQVLIYNLSYQEEDLEDNKFNLVGHQAQGYALCWNPLQSNLIASGSYDNKILIWDINKSQKQIQPSHCFYRDDSVEDIKWSYDNSNIFCASSQDKQISLYDLRQNSKKPAINKSAHNGQIYSLDFNKFCKNLLLSGGQEGDVYLWDIRNMSKKLNNFIGHNDAITALQWSPNNQFEFLSGSADRKIVLWDMNKINQPQKSSISSQKNQSDISFIHGGHRSRITDLAWSNEKYVVASCEQNNNFQVWQMTQSLIKY